MNIGKWLIFAGLGLVAVGILFWLGSRFGLPIGKLPGDVRIQREKFGFYFPLVSSILISILLTIVINFILWLMKK